jgi:MFS family permease
MRLGFGNLGERVGRKPVALASTLLYVLVVGGMARLDASKLWLHGAGSSFAHGVLYPTLIALASERAPPRTQGRVIAAFSGAFNVGASAGSAAWGGALRAARLPPC